MPLWFHACEHQLHEGHGKDLSSTEVVDAPKATNIGQVNLISLPPKGLFSTGKQSYHMFFSCWTFCLHFRQPSIRGYRDMFASANKPGNYNKNNTFVSPALPGGASALI